MKPTKINIKKHIKNEKGAITIFVGIALITLMAMASVVTDLGMTYITANKVQNAADAGALAAAKDLPLLDTQTNKTKLSTLAKNYVAQNGVDSSTVTIEYITESGYIRGIKVTGEQTKDNMLIKLISDDNDTTTIYRGAQAEVFSLSKITKTNGYNGVIPIGVQKSVIDYITSHDSNSQDYYSMDLTEDPVPGSPALKHAYMNFDHTKDGIGDGNGASDPKDWTENGYDYDLIVSTQSFSQNPEGYHDYKLGQVSSVIKEYNDRYDDCTMKSETNPLKHEANCPRFALVPIIVVEQVQINNKTVDKAKVIGFAQIFIEKYDKANKDMNARFLKTMNIDGEAGSSTTITEYSVYTSKLTK